MNIDSFFQSIRDFVQNYIGPTSLESPLEASKSVGLVPIEPLSPFIIGLTVFALACFVGYYVVWRVTPALHSPLMAVTNAISSVIIVGTLIASASDLSPVSQIFGFIGVTLAAINIFGGFAVTDRMLKMFKSK